MSNKNEKKDAGEGRAESRPERPTKREERVKAALRANLQRRKAKARALKKSEENAGDSGD